MIKLKKISFGGKLLLLFLFLNGISAKCVAQDVDYKAYTLFVYNFMKYVEWPEAQSKGDFVVCVFGDSPIQKELAALATTKKLKGRNIVIKNITKAEEAAGCQLLYVSSSKSGNIKALKEQMMGKPILIVGEREGLAKKGAELSFVTMDDDELKFDINKKEIEQHQLKISSQLIALGIVVN
ncbi:MAG TPA: YfiR family protein [Bacteroidia bacterium]|nr:YfiR family protein [Bacteroidia bacterium]